MSVSQISAGSNGGDSQFMEALIRERSFTQVIGLIEDDIHKTASSFSGVMSTGSPACDRSLTSIIDQHASWRQRSTDGAAHTLWTQDFDTSVEYLRNETVGRNRILEGPLGPKLKVYMDYTASGQGLHFVNSYMQWIRESFANTHTEDSATGRFMTDALNMALKSIETCVHAGDDFVALCVGTGSTGAMQRLQQILGIYVPPAAWTKLGALLGMATSSAMAHERVALKIVPNCSVSGPAPVKGECPEWLQARERVKSVLRSRGQLPLVIVGGYEHHSNELSWREGLCDVARIPLTKSFELDLDALQILLQEERRKNPSRSIIGSISACSNVTGMKTDVRAVSQLLREAGALFFVDYAASAPYEDLDVCPDDNKNLLDGIFVSPHKFLGGDGSCGLLVLRKSIYDLRLPPTMSGGGTVKAVSKAFQAYSDDIVERENAGTPGALQIYQCALAFEVKAALGAQNIMDREHEVLIDFFKWLKEKHPEDIKILGNQDAHKRHSIVSFNVVGPHPLHPRFVTVLLSDLFGIQTRAGCSCAGPHGADLFEAPTELERTWLSLIVGTSEGHSTREIQDVGMISAKPGWCRLNLHYTLDQDDLWYLKEALTFVVENGASFLRIYSFDMVSGAWSFAPPASVRDTISKHIQPRDHEFGLQTALAGGHSRAFATSCDRRRALEAQLREARRLYAHLPSMPAIVPPPAPLSGHLPSHGPGPWFMVAEGQVHNLEGFRECQDRHNQQFGSMGLEMMQVPSTFSARRTASAGRGIQLKVAATADSSVSAMTVSWKNLSVMVESAKSPSKHQHVLRSCFGRVEPNDRLCLFGPSGSGKSTLLEAVGGRLSTSSGRQVRGDILVNGDPVDAGFRFLCGFIAETQVLHGELTVYETLRRAADLRLPFSMAGAKKRKKVQELINTMGLAERSTQRVGPGVLRPGLSSPNLLKLTVATELISNPSLLLLDDVTLGLEQQAAEEVMRTVCWAAAQTRTTIIAAMSDVLPGCWQLFEKVCLMARGRVAFFGQRMLLMPHLEAEGYSCPAYTRPADFCIHILASSHDADIGAEIICDRFEASAKGMQLLKASGHEGVGRTSSEVPIRGSYNLGPVSEGVMLIRHMLVKSVRDLGLYWIRAMVALITFLLIALFFGRLDGQYDFLALQSRIALCFLLSVFPGMLTVAAIPQMIKDRAVTSRETASGNYRVWTQHWASFLVSLPALAFMAGLATILIGPSTGLMAITDLFCAMFLSFLMAEAVVGTIIEVTRNYAVAIALTVSLYGWGMLIEAFLLTRPTVPQWLEWTATAVSKANTFQLALHSACEDVKQFGTTVLVDGVDLLSFFDDDKFNESRSKAILLLAAFALQLVTLALKWWWRPSFAMVSPAVSSESTLLSAMPMAPTPDFMEPPKAPMRADDDEEILAI